jgi:hypothetical protein
VKKKTVSITVLTTASVTRVQNASAFWDLKVRTVHKHTVIITVTITDNV